MSNCESTNYEFAELTSVTEVQVSVDHAYFIQVATNPTTGFDWIIDTDDCDGIVEIIQEYERDDERGDMPGVGGTTYWTLIGLSEGECTFRGVKERSWDFLGWDAEETSNTMGYFEIPFTVSEFCAVDDDCERHGTYYA